ncbi:unnamed protein product, partial [Rotaria socialis]
YRPQTSLLGALPSAAALRATQGAVYATTAGLANGIGGQIFYGGVVDRLSLDIVEDDDTPVPLTIGTDGLS